VSWEHADVDGMTSARNLSSPTSAYQLANDHYLAVANALFGTSGYPPDLIAFPRICANLRRALILLKRHAGLDLEKYGLKIIPPDLRKISRTYRTNDDLGAASRRNPLLGRGATAYPLYTALWHVHQDLSLRDTYAMVQAHFALTFALSQAQAEQLSLHNVDGHSAYPASLAVRYLSVASNPAAIALLQILPVAQLPERFAVELGEISSPQSREAAIRLRDIYLYFHNIHADIPYFPRTVDRAGGPGGSTWLLGDGSSVSIPGMHVIQRGDPDTPSSRSGFVLRLTNGVIDPLLRSRAFNEDCSPFEPTGADELDLFDCDQVDASEMAPARLTLLSTKQMRAANRPDHLMLWSDHLLAIPEVTPLMVHTERLITADADARLSDLCAAAILQCSFWSGWPLDESAHLRVFVAGSRNDDAKLAVLLGDGPTGNNDWWRITALRPPYRTADKLINGQAHIPQDYIWLPLPSVMSRLLRVIIERKRILIQDSGELPSSRIFGWNSSIRHMINDLLHQLDPGGRLTKTRIRETLPGLLIVRSGGDASLASLIFGREHPLASVELYYDGITTDEAIQTYSDLVHTLETQWMISSQSTTNPCPVGPGYLGCRYTPTAEALIGAIGFVRAEARNILGYAEDSLSYSDNGFIRAHNFYTLYLTWWLGYACGIRGITTPMIRLQNVDPETGICIWSEKDDGSGYKSRILWIPANLLRELNRYSIYLRRVGCAMEIDKTWSELPGYFLDKSGRPELISPASIASLTEDFFAFPANTHRRVMRQALRRSSCPVQIIKAWMNHWVADQEPWSVFSGMGITGLRAGFELYIPPIVSFLGFYELTDSEGHDD
jgi:hypothetical protein